MTWLEAKTSQPMGLYHDFYVSIPLTQFIWDTFCVKVPTSICCLGWISYFSFIKKITFVMKLLSFNFLSRLINQEYDHFNPKVLLPQSSGPISNPFCDNSDWQTHKDSNLHFSRKKVNPPTRNRINFGFFLGCGSNILRQYHINGQI